VLDANYYLDAETQQRKVKLQGKCQLAELPSAGVTWDTDDNGFVVAAHGKEMEVKYRYDADGYPLGKTTVPAISTVRAVDAVKDLRKRMDYTAVSMLNDKPLGNVKQSCDYDRHNNPVSCDLMITTTASNPPLSTNTPSKTVLITIKKTAQLLRGRFQLSRAGCFVPGQVLMLEDAHADGVAVFTVDKELMNQFAFHHKAQLAVDMDRFFVLFIHNQIKLVEIQTLNRNPSPALPPVRRDLFPDAQAK
jgi:hypothetical protein